MFLPSLDSTGKRAASRSVQFEATRPQGFKTERPTNPEAPVMRPWGVISGT